MKKSTLLCVAATCVLSISAQAHTIEYVLDAPTRGSVFMLYLLEGFKHIIPLGVDHILFILCIFFLNTQLKPILLQASMFTLAHTITLGLSMYGIIQLPAGIVEPLIALSIVLLAVENMFYREVRPHRLITVFIFGLVHGMGFAGALSDLGMPSNAFFTALISFNLGVELGQISIILLMYYLITRNYGQKAWYRAKLVLPLSIFIAIVAGYWTIERLLSQ